MLNQRNFMIMAPEGETGGASVVDDMASRLSSPEGTFTDDFTPPANPTEGNGDDVIVDGVESAFKPSAYWDIVKDVEGFTMPEAITADNEMELLRPYVAKKFGIEPVKEQSVNLHPYAAKVQEILSTNPDIDIKQLTTQLVGDNVDYDSMSSDELIRYELYRKYGHYDEQNNKDGLTEDDINDELSKMSKVNKRISADNIRENLKAESIKKQEALKEEVLRRNEQQINEYTESLNKTSSELLVKMTKVNDIYGIKLGQSELPVLIDEFKSFLTIPKDTGVRKIDEWLSNDENLFKMFVVMVKSGEDSFKELITRGREQAKKDILEKLFHSRTLEGSQGNNLIGNADLRERLSKPEGTYN